MAQLYYLGASLPFLKLGETPDITFEELMFRFEIDLDRKQLAIVKILRYMIDIDNIRRLLLREPLDRRGNLGEKELDEVLLNREELTDYIFDFFHKYDTSEERLKNFSELWSSYFREEPKRNKGFIESYLRFEQELRLVLTALRAKKMQRDIARELQFEDFSDPFVAQILAQKDSPEYLPPLEFGEIKEVFTLYGDEPLEYHKRIEEFRFKHLQERASDMPFSINRIYSYMQRLIIVENWLMLNDAQGRAKLSRLLVQQS